MLKPSIIPQQRKDWLLEEERTKLALYLTIRAYDNPTNINFSMITFHRTLISLMMRLYSILVIACSPRRTNRPRMTYDECQPQQQTCDMKPILNVYGDVYKWIPAATSITTPTLENVSWAMVNVSLCSRQPESWWVYLEHFFIIVSVGVPAMNLGGWQCEWRLEMWHE